MEGKWEIRLPSDQYHANILKGKRHCSLASNCFGVSINANSGVAYSINFPLQLKEGEISYINRKESISGDFVYQECLLVMIACNKL